MSSLSRTAAPWLTSADLHGANDPQRGDESEKRTDEDWYLSLIYNNRNNSVSPNCVHTSIAINNNNNNNNNNNTSICKAHSVSIRAESEAPIDVELAWTILSVEILDTPALKTEINAKLTVLQY